VATDANGCKDSTTATITQPTPLILSAAAFAATCNGTCNGSATALPKGGTGAYTYLWSNSQTGATANNLCAGSYSVIVTDANGCVHDSNPLTVTQPAPLVLTKTKPVSAYCNQADGSDTATVTGGTPPYQYAWVKSSNTSIPITLTTNLDNVPPGSYCFGVQDANKCVDSICTIIPNTPGETASITGATAVSCNGGSDGTATGTATGGSAPYTYSWNSNPTQSTPTATGLKAGTYTLTVTDATNCKDTAIATVTQPAVVVATTTASPATICMGDSSVISASATGGTPPYSFSWNTGCTSSSCIVYPTLTTTYTVTPSDANKCLGAPVQVVVTVAQPLKVVAGSPKYVCPGFSATITAKASGGNGTYTYVWTPGNFNGSSVSVTPAATSYYKVTVTDGCTKLPAIDSVLVTVKPDPVVAFTADTNNGCNPVCVVFTDKSTIAAGYSLKSWNWSFGDGSSSKAQDTAHCYTTVGQYSVSLKVTSDSGCVATLTQNNYITVYDHPHTDFLATPQPTTILSSDITFTDQTTDPYGIIQWLWSLGDPTSASDTAVTQNTSHKYADTGTYCVTLKDINKHLCIGSVTKCIVIDPLFTFYIPSAFTPNADGKNDVFIPKGTFFASFDMYIFDRWGMRLYHTSDINKGWNGAVNNGSTPCQQDTYIYVINATDFKGLTHSYTGKITLIR